MQEDHTQGALEHINNIIKEGKKLGKAASLTDIEKHDASMYHNVAPRWETVVAISIDPPKTVYTSFMSEEGITDPLFAWALWWAKEKGIIEHYGPGGTIGWSLYRGEPLAIDEIYVGDYSPFNTSSMMKYMDHILKYSALMHTKAMENQRDAEKSIEKTRQELESEKEYARLQSRIAWS